MAKFSCIKRVPSSKGMHRGKSFEMICLLCLLAACLVAVASKPAGYRQVVRVYDGDTILLQDGNEVRYLGIDAPEIGRKGRESECFAHEARVQNLALTKRSSVRLEWDEERRDHYGRLLAYVFLKNGDMVNGILLRRGLAFVLLRGSGLKHAEFLIRCQREAMREKRGLWSRLLEDGENRYMGNRRSKVFHRADCPFGRRISPRNQVCFESVHDACWEGFSPCRRCDPVRRVCP